MHATTRLSSCAALALAALLIGWLGTYTDIDLRLADAAFDAQSQTFPWRHAWLTETFGHVLLKRALTGVALLMIALALWPLRRSAKVRLVAMSAVLVPLIIAGLKQISSSHCPWDIDRYGGTAPYVRLLDAMPGSIDAGHCMPGGHASSALWLIAFAVFPLPARPRLAAACFSVLLAFGVAVGWLQQLRGAHFLTHTLWSAWIACAVFLALVIVNDYISNKFNYL